MLEQLLKLIGDFQKEAKEAGWKPTDTDATKVADALKGNEATQPIYQHVHDAGFDGAYGRKSERERNLETELAEAKKRADKAEAAVTRMKEEQPDVAALEEKYRGELEEKDQAITRLREEHDSDLDSIARDRAVATLAAKLVEKGVHPKWANVEAREAVDRLKVQRAEDGKDRSVQVLRQAGGVQALQADDPIDALATELRESVAPEFITAAGDSGSGVREGGTGGGGGGGIYDKVRQQAQAEHEKQRTDGPSGLARLRGERVPAKTES